MMSIDDQDKVGQMTCQFLIFIIYIKIKIAKMLEAFQRIYLKNGNSPLHLK